MKAGGEPATAVVMEMITPKGEEKLPPGMTDQETQFDIWRDMTAIVEGHNQPRTFSAYIGFEWSSNYGGGNNLHRNVICRDRKALANHVRPLTTFHTELSHELRDWMANYEAKTGGADHRHGAGLHLADLVQRKRLTVIQRPMTQQED